LLHATVGGLRSNSIPFHIDTVSQEREREPNAGLGSAQELKPPVIVNGASRRPATRISTASKAGAITK
jgi:hypothetical protein